MFPVPLPRTRPVSTCGEELLGSPEPCVFVDGVDLTASSVVSRMFRSFERSCLPREIRSPDWNLFLVLRCLSRPPFEPLKFASDKHLTWKTSVLLALA